MMHYNISISLFDACYGNFESLNSMTLGCSVHFYKSIEVVEIVGFQLVA
jgi:hypothetical protein